eukprot:4603992-Alexandrium_andersonii.AAC.1
MPGTDEFYLCRRRSCLAVCRNTDWATTDKNGGGHYRCPGCGERFCPSMEQPGYVKANKVWMTQKVPNFNQRTTADE